MKKLCALILALTLLLTNFSISVYALDSYADAKIDSNLTTAISESSSDTATAYVTMAGLDEDTFMAYFQEHYPVDYAVYMYAKYDIEPQMDGVNEITDEMIQTAIETKRAVYKQLNTKLSNEIIGRYYGGDEVLFISGYAPIAIVETDAYALTWIARRSDVESVVSFKNGNEECVFTYEENDASRSGATCVYPNIMTGIDLANQISRADIVRDDKGMTGEGVKIGIIEPGIPDASIEQLSSAQITICPESGSVQLHTTVVTSYLVASETNGVMHGIVPDAEIYCCGMTGTITSLYEGIEWLIDQGVNIINASMGGRYYVNNVAVATYDKESAWIDHLAIQHDVHFVKSAGNHKTAQENAGRDLAYRVSTPGLAYNAITVGNFLSHGTYSLDNFTFNDSRSCYEEESGYTDGPRPEKPNLVACGQLKDVFYDSGSNTYSDYSGTSFSAPQVAGVIAQLCDYSSKLKTKQTQVAAILTASAARKVDGAATGEKGDIFDTSVSVELHSQVSDKEGAGILDARWAWGIVVNHNHWSANLNAEDFPYTQTVTIDTSKNTLTRVAIFWLKRNTVTSHTTGEVDSDSNPLPNLNLYVYAPDGTLLGYSSLTFANFEIVQFIPPETGEYRIVINGSPNHKSNVGIAVW